MQVLSSGDTIIVVAMILIYIVITSYLSFRWGGSTNDDFMRASRRLPTFVLGIFLMSEYIGAQSTVGAAQSAFSSGIAASWAILAAVVGFVLYALFFVRRLYNSGGFTISGSVEKQYGRSTKIVVSIIMIYALFLVNVGNYLSGASVLVQLLGVKLPIAMVIVGIVSTIYFAFGGMKSVAYVSVIHTFAKYFGLLLTAVFALILTGGIKPLVTEMPKFYFTLDGTIGWGTILGWILTTVGAVFSTQFLVQAISSAKSDKSAQHASFLAAALFIPLGLAIGIIGVAAKYLFPEMDSLYALPVFLTHMNVFMAGFVATALVASVFVSVSTVALGLVALVVDDFYVPMKHPEPKQQLRMTRMLSIVVGFLPLIFAFVAPQILELSFFSKALRMSITIVAVAGFYLPHFGTAKSANTALIGTALLSTIWFLLGDPFGIDNIYISIFAPVVIMILFKLGNISFGKMGPEEKAAIESIEAE